MESEDYMADIIIKGVKIPKSCALCPVKLPSEYKDMYTCPFIDNYYFSDIAKNRSPGCPLRELPAHGPLIDISTAQVVIPESREVKL